jgi:hypothetical protein
MALPRASVRSTWPRHPSGAVGSQANARPPRPAPIGAPSLLYWRAPVIVVSASRHFISLAFPFALGRANTQHPLSAIRLRLVVIHAATNYFCPVMQSRVPCAPLTGSLQPRRLMDTIDFAKGYFSMRERSLVKGPTFAAHPIRCLVAVWISRLETTAYKPFGVFGNDCLEFDDYGGTHGGRRDSGIVSAVYRPYTTIRFRFTPKLDGIENAGYVKSRDSQFANAFRMETELRSASRGVTGRG